MSENKAFKAFFIEYYVKHGFVYSEGEARTFFEAGQRQGMERAAEIAEKTEAECCSPDDPCTNFDEHECIYEASREPCICAANFIRKELS